MRRPMLVSISQKSRNRKMQDSKTTRASAQEKLKEKMSSLFRQLEESSKKQVEINDRGWRSQNEKPETRLENQPSS